jgi:ABC-type phosphate transport system permease subunit
MLYNDHVIDVPRVDQALDEQGNRHAFERLLVKASYMLALSFIISAVLNFVLAIYLLKSPPGTAEFNDELAKMHFLSWPIIVVPSMGMTVFVLWRLLGGIKRITGLEMDAIFKAPPEKPAKAG